MLIKIKLITTKVKILNINKNSIRKVISFKYLNIL